MHCRCYVKKKCPILSLILYPSHFPSVYGVCADETELKSDRKVRPFSMFEPTEAPTTSLRKNQSSDDLVRDAQVRRNEISIPESSPFQICLLTSRVTAHHLICSLLSFFPVCSEGSDQSAPSRSHETERP